MLLNRRPEGKIARRIFFAVIVLLLFFFVVQPAVMQTTVNEELLDEEMDYLIKNIFTIRNIAMCEGNLEIIKELYNTDLRNGLWAFLHEQKKVEYLRNWSEKQCVEFTDINSDIKIKWSKGNEQSATVNMLASTTYTYIYKDEPEVENSMRIGTYHELKLARSEDDRWLITREWYTDPFADSLNLDKDSNIQENRKFILSNTRRDFPDLDQRRIDTVNYAKLYCGAAGTAETDYSYNPKYKNYNSLGGDCANFVSQALYEGGKFKKTYIWSYDRDGSRAWLKAQGLKDFMVNSGRGSLIAYGSYEKVLEASYKLLPGDIVAYEKKGEITHVSLVTDADSRGYSVVTCHNTDRHNVPWDLGWSNTGIRFYFIRVHY